MEHSLQVLLAVVVAYGIVRGVEGGRFEWWFWAACIIGPLVRYENASITLAGLLVAFILGRRRAALLTGAVAVVPLVAFTAVLGWLGLPPLPSSVVVKWGPYSGGFGNLPRTLLAGVVTHLTRFSVTGLVAFALVAASLVGFGAVNRGHIAGRRLLPLVSAAAVMCAHIAVGADGWFSRYEVYALSFALVIVSAGLAPILRRAAVWAGGPMVASALVLMLAALFPSLWSAERSTVSAAHGVYLQQVQMHRLVVDCLRAPVAINDLGAVSYRNELGVVDLWGLGSFRAIEARQRGAAGWASELVDPAKVPAALLYRDWFEDGIPRSWVGVGTIQTESAVSLGGDTVTVWATSRESVERVRAALAAYRTHAPRGTAVTLGDGP